MNIYRGRSHTEVYLASILYDSIEDQDLRSVKRLLLEKGADPNIILPGRGISCFHLAIGNDCTKFAMEVVSLIIQHGGNPNVPSDEGLTPMHIAAAWGRVDILRLLLHCGGDYELTDNTYKTALRYATEEGCEEAATVIREFMNCQRVSVYDKCVSKEEPCQSILDKVLLSNGCIVGEYEIKTEIEQDPVPQLNLDSLPQTTSQEYVLNWCNKNELTCNSTDFTEDSSGDLESFKNKAFIKSMKDSRTKNYSVPTNHDDRLFAKPQPKGKFRNVTKRDKGKLFVKNCVCKYKEISRESGIVTLFESSDDGGYSDHEYVEKDSCLYSDNKITKNLEIPNIKEISKDTSSDYCTCPEGSETTSILDRTIYESSGNKIVTTAKSSNSNEQDLSFVSVSEVYKHIDQGEGLVLYEKRILVTSVNSQNDSRSTSLSHSSLPKSFDYDTDTLRRELTIQGFDPGPITKTTKRVYLRKLYQLKKHPQIVPSVSDDDKRVYSSELEHTLKDSNWHQDLTQHQHLEDLVKKQFTNVDADRKWREGVAKSSFTYLLLDPRLTQNLPHRCEQLGKKGTWEAFLSAVFYVGKGKRSRPFSHLYAAVSNHQKAASNTESKKINRILDIWKDSHGVVCLHVFQNVIPVEAYTREAAMISALKLANITNVKTGDFYGVSATWSQKQKNLLGVYLLYKAMKIFLNEGERQIFPSDIE